MAVEVVTRVAHENAQVVSLEQRVADDVMARRQVEGDARGLVVVQFQIRKRTRLGTVTGEAVKFVVHACKIPDCETPDVMSCYQATGAAARGGDVFDSTVGHALDGNAVVANVRTGGLPLPSFELLLMPVAINAQVGHSQPGHGGQRD